MLIALVLIVAGFILLAVGAEALVRGSAALALRLGVPPFVVGLTVVGFGTSTPELAATVGATVRGVPGIAIGNVIGSSTLNLAVVLAITAIVRPISVRFEAIRFELTVALLAAAIPFLALLTGGSLGPLTGGALLAALLAITVRAYIMGRRHPGAEESEMERELAELVSPEEGSRWSSRVWFDVLLTLVGLIVLPAGSWLLVEGAIDIATRFGIPDLIVGLTIVALGTSLPELATALVAALRGKSDLALGNVLGSNIFNMLGILGVATLLGRQEIEPQTLRVDTPVLLGTSIAVALMCMTGRRINRPEGILLLAGYGVYLGYLVSVAT